MGAPVQNNVPAPQQSLDDLLGGSVFPVAQPVPQTQQVGAMYSLDNMLGGGASNPTDGLMGIGMGVAATSDVQFAAASDCDGEKF